MEIYLPIAEMSVSWPFILALGFAIGFLSGVFGVGGGFLLTPLLIFYGIPPGVAVATTSSQIVGATFSGVLSHWKRKTVDFKMGAVMIASGLIGSGAGVLLFAALRRMGQAEFTVSASYVLLLGSVGAIMFNESVRTLRRLRDGGTAPARTHGQHNWIHGLPFKMRFRQSRLYISVIPPAVLGFVVGTLSATLGIGGAFISVPVMIYLFRMPTNVVVGTSMFQILFVSAASTVLHAADNYTVDAMLGLILILGGVFGAQYGVRVGAKLRGEQLRFLMALLVLAVAFGLFWQLVLRPEDLYALTRGTP
jgi:uncharacterized membrane protein YfcA